MKTLYGLGEVDPSGTDTSLPSFIRESRISCAREISQALSNTENIRALSVENIFSVPTARATSPAPDFK
jgi:hypothetical protein